MYSKKGQIITLAFKKTPKCLKFPNLVTLLTECELALALVLAGVRLDVFEYALCVRHEDK